MPQVRMLQMFAHIQILDKELEDIWFGMVVQKMDSNMVADNKMQESTTQTGTNVVTMP